MMIDRDDPSSDEASEALPFHGLTSLDDVLQQPAGAQIPDYDYPEIVPLGQSNLNVRRVGRNRKKAAR